MHFLEPDEAKRLEKKIRREIAGKPKLVLYYSSGNRDYAAAADAITASIGAFTAATMLFLFCVSVDDGTADGPWTRYRQWRSANGDARPIYDAPGHQFESHEARQLSEAIVFCPRTRVGCVTRGDAGAQAHGTVARRSDRNPSRFRRAFARRSAARARILAPLRAFLLCAAFLAHSSVAIAGSHIA
jgi:hypothetical protein